MTKFFVDCLPTGGILIGLEDQASGLDLTGERAKSLHDQGIPHMESPCPICRAEVLAQEWDEQSIQEDAMTANDPVKATAHYCKSCGNEFTPSVRKPDGRYCGTCAIHALLGPIVGDVDDDVTISIIEIE